MNASFTVIIHIYYENSWRLIEKKCAWLLQSAEQTIITYCHDQVADEINRPGVILLKVPNVGKDIGGKLVSLNYYLQFGRRTDLLIFLHDKISPQTINADYWFNELYSIFDRERFQSALELFEKKKQVGIVGSRSFLKNEYDRQTQSFETTNNDLLTRLIKEYGLVCREYFFIAGTIFIARSRIYEAFFLKYAPLKIREKLERGNVLDLGEGTYTHCWERLLSFIAEDQGYVVKSV